MGDFNSCLVSYVYEKGTHRTISFSECGYRLLQLTCVLLLDILSVRFAKNFFKATFNPVSSSVTSFPQNALPHAPYPSPYLSNDITRLEFVPISYSMVRYISGEFNSFYVKKLKQKEQRKTMQYNNVTKYYILVQYISL